jgi:hypothetical protein
VGNEAVRSIDPLSTLLGSLEGGVQTVRGVKENEKSEHCRILMRAYATLTTRLLGVAVRINSGEAGVRRR